MLERQASVRTSRLPDTPVILLVAAGLLPLAVHGCCTTHPSAVTSHPKVFSSEYFRVMERENEKKEKECSKEANCDQKSCANKENKCQTPFAFLNTDFQGLDRYFATKEGEWSGNELRMDKMLDDYQSNTIIRQDAMRGGGYVPSEADLTAATLDSSDSPFDRLDRASSFYLSVLGKYLRIYHDARTFDVATYDAHNPPEWKDKALSASGYREYLLMHQVNVDPANSHDRMVGLRVRIVKANQDEAMAGLVQILRLHPDRTYDTEPVQFSDRLLELTGAKTENTRVAAKAALQVITEQGFTHRIGKCGSYIDAGQRVYGWNFYPSNVQVTERSLFARFWRSLFWSPSKYALQSRLEAGGRDTMVSLLVPKGITSLTLQAWYVEGSIEEGPIKEHPPTGTFTVSLN